ncbi:MAG: C45 family autoproteolytic acyltransferase/hydrolase [Candidatus Kariarchaeaceae archaeon]|jgi:predicted choloylglycine hydrolase
MMKKEKIITKSFSFLELIGSSYEVGKQQGLVVKDNPDALKYFTRGSFKSEISGFSSLEETLEFYESYIPGLTDEFKGFAAGAGVSIDQLVPIDFPNSIQNHCSHIVCLSSITNDKHIYVARTYDWHYDDEDMRLLITKVNGKYAHVGFSTLLSGRTDGINSEGLCVTMSGGGAWDYKLQTKRAFNYSFAIRALLDQCNTTKKAINLLEDMPANTSTHYLIADKSGHAAIVEGIDCEYAIREIDKDTDDQYLFSTNYYTSEKMQQYNKYVNSYLKSMNKMRENIITNFIDSKSPRITKKDLISLLSKGKPDGICAPYYSEWFGNLWSMVFDVTNGTVEICMGTPGYNNWEQYSLEKSKYPAKLTAKFIDQPSGFG